jgi:uncharacterized protein YjbI with pentapeptide repeats
LEPPRPPNGIQRRTSAGPRLRAPAAPTSAPGLPPIAAKADDLEAIKKAVDDAASVGGGLWLSYPFVLFYLGVAAGAVTHADLFLENPVKLPFLNIELPLLAFFFLAPILFIIVHAYTLVHLVFLTDKAKRFHQALHDPERSVDAAARQNLQWQLPSNIFIQFLAGPSDVRDSAFGYLLRAIAWVTLVVAPILLLLMMQIQFLPFHSGFIAWTQRGALLADLVLIWWLWRKILSGRMPGPYLGPRLLWATAGVAFTLAMFLFSWMVATFPGEWQDNLPNQRVFWFPFPKPDRDLGTLNRLVFQSDVDETTRRRWLPLSNTLVLTGFNIYEGLGIDDPEKTKWHDFVFRARGRDLRNAIFDLASLPKVDFTGAELQGASLYRARLQGALLDEAQLQGALLLETQLQGASLNDARLQSASLDEAQLQGASLMNANLRGTSLAGTQLEGASLYGAQLQGASLAHAQLQGASLFQTQLQGASLVNANLRGATLVAAQLQGAWLQGAALEVTDLSDAYLWRTNGATTLKGDVAKVVAVRLPSAPNTWLPLWKDGGHKVHPWNDTAYRDLRHKMESLPPGLWRDPALDGIRRLDCGNPDTTLASCDASLAPPPEAAAWRTSLEGAGVDVPIYVKALAAAFKALVCSGSNDPAYALRGLLADAPLSRLSETGPEAPALIDFIMSKDCPASASLTEEDKAKLLRIKQEAIKRAGN